MYQTLHGHTTDSDGKQDHFSLMDLCKKNNVSTVAFTDHDSLPSEKTLKKLMGINSEVRWISGIEISSGWPNDLGGGSTSGLHVVGLFVDPTDKNLLDHCVKAKAARITRMQEIVKNLNEIGIKVTVDDCLSESGGESVARPHIVSAILKRKENNKIINELKLKFFEASKNNPELKKQYTEMMKLSERQHLYNLFLSPDSFIKGIYVDYQYYSDFDQSVKLIRDAGGVSILAHWFTCKDKFDDSYLKSVLDKKRIDGIETVLGIGPGGLMDRNEVDGLYTYLTGLSDKYGVVASGGVDLHSESELTILNNEEWYAKRTINMAEKMIESLSLSTKWSSIN